MLDYLIQNARIIDDSGSKEFAGNVGLQDGKICLCGQDTPAKEVIDAKGRYLLPGFIDCHSHGDLLVDQSDLAPYKITQGITTDVAGHCGSSVAPVDPRASGVAHPEWEHYPAYLDSMDALPKVGHSMFLVGHCTLREAVMGMDNRKPTAAEMDKMKALLKEAMEAGARGFSTGLIYPPSCYADEEELVELAKVMAPYDGIYTSHMRNESDGVVEAVKETINIGRRAGVKVLISHHKVLGKRNWGRQKETLAVIEQANKEGVQVFCDQYPYTRTMTYLNACIPPWHFSDGYEAMAEKLKSPAFRKQLKEEMENPETPYDNFYLNTNGWNDILICSGSATPDALGKTVAAYADFLGKDVWETFFDVCVLNKCKNYAVYTSMCDEDVCEIFQYPRCMVGTDGVSLPWNLPNHPRSTSTFPHAINFFYKEKQLMPLEQVVHKMTGLPATFIALPNKGFIRDGYDGDLVLMNLDALQEGADFRCVNGYCKGIDMVFVDGCPVYADGAFTGKTPGRILRHKKS